MKNIEQSSGSSVGGTATNGVLQVTASTGIDENANATGLQVGVGVGFWLSNGVSIQACAPY